jgi:hypothetical protein
LVSTGNQDCHDASAEAFAIKPQETSPTVYVPSWIRSLHVKAVEFESTIRPGGQIALPPEVAREIPAGEQLRIVVMWDSSGADDAWRSAGRERFEAAYSPEDAVYEQLIDDAAAR